MPSTAIDTLKPLLPRATATRAMRASPSPWADLLGPFGAESIGRIEGVRGDYEHERRCAEHEFIPNGRDVCDCERLNASKTPAPLIRSAMLTMRRRSRREAQTRNDGCGSVFDFAFHVRHENGRQTYRRQRSRPVLAFDAKPHGTR